MERTIYLAGTNELLRVCEMKKMLLLGMLSVFLFSCKNDSKVQNVERAFYYWKSDRSEERRVGKECRP